MTQRREPELVFDVDVGAARHECVDDVELASRGGGDQRGATIGVLHVGTHAGVNERVDGLYIARLGRRKKSLLVEVVAAQLQNVLDRLVTLSRQIRTSNRNEQTARNHEA